MVSVALASLLVIATGQLRADPAYKVGGGKISFSVGSNVPFLKVSGSSSAVKGSGEGTVAGMSRKCAVLDSRSTRKR